MPTRAGKNVLDDALDDDADSNVGADADAESRECGRERADDAAVAALKCDNDAEDGDEASLDLDGEDKAERVDGSALDDDDDDECKFAAPPPLPRAPITNATASSESFAAPLRLPAVIPDAGSAAQLTRASGLAAAPLSTL